MNWTKYMSSEVYERLCNCRTIHADLHALVDARWCAYVESGKAEHGFTKEDALIAVLELLDCNSQTFDVSIEEYNDLCA